MNWSNGLLSTFLSNSNIGSSQLNHYSTAAIPVAVGAVFFVDKLVEMMYNEVSLARKDLRLSEGYLESKKQSPLNVFDSIRQGLAHPFPATNTIKCFVASVNGLDSASTQDRATVASRLWAVGIPSEYLPQTGTFTSLLRHCDRDSNKLGSLASVSISAVLSFG